MPWRLPIAVAVAIALVAVDPGWSIGSGAGTASAETDAGTRDNAIVAAVRRTAGRVRRSSGRNNLVCRFFHPVDGTPDDPFGSIGPEEFEYWKLPDGTPLWRACYRRSDGGLAFGPQAWFVGTNPYDQVRLARVTIEPPRLVTSPPGGILPGLSARLDVAGTREYSTTATLGAESMTAYARLIELRFRIVPSSDRRLASPDDGREIVCTVPQVTPLSTTGGPCTHRFAGPARDVTIETTATWLTWGADSSGAVEHLAPIRRTSVATLRVGTARTRIRPRVGELD